MELSWDSICETAKQNNKTVICEVEKRGTVRYFLLKCNICGYESNGILSRNSCKGCSKGRKRRSTQDFIQQAVLVHGDLYNYDLVEYINSSTKVKIVCNKCNKIFEQIPRNHTYGHGCQSCSMKINNILIHRSSKDEFIEKAKKVHGDKYNYDLIDYVNNKIKVKILCNNCNKIFEQIPSSHTRGRGCPSCKQSEGEVKIKKYLLQNNIAFTPEKKFESLKNIIALKFDFYLDDINLLIEYDGEGHYFPCFGSTQEQKQKNLEDCQRRDKIKNEWALKNNIPLLRIPYWDFDRIEELIKAFILEHTKLSL
jgi:protein-arginine kinase activator protein McsA